MKRLLQVSIICLLFSIITVLLTIATKQEEIAQIKGTPGGKTELKGTMPSTYNPQAGVVVPTTEQNLQGVR